MPSKPPRQWGHCSKPRLPGNGDTAPNHAPQAMGTLPQTTPPMQWGQCPKPRPPRQWGHCPKPRPAQTPCSPRPLAAPDSLQPQTPCSPPSNRFYTIQESHQNMINDLSTDIIKLKRTNKCLRTQEFLGHETIMQQVRFTKEHQLTASDWLPEVILLAFDPYHLLCGHLPHTLPPPIIICGYNQYTLYLFLLLSNPHSLQKQDITNMQKMYFTSNSGGLIKDMQHEIYILR